MAFQQCSIGTKGPKVCQENTPTPLHPQHQPEPLRQGRMIHAFMFFTPNSDPTSECSRNPDSSDQATFFNLLSSSFGEPVWIVSSVSCSYLTGAAPGVVFCCWSPSASGFDVLCVQRWYSADLGCNKWLFESLLPCSNSDARLQIWVLQTKTRFLVFKSYLLNYCRANSWIA